MVETESASQSPSGDSSLRRAGVVTPYEKESLHKVEIESASQSPSGDSSLRRAGVVTPYEKESL